MQKSIISDNKVHPQTLESLGVFIEQNNVINHELHENISIRALGAAIDEFNKINFGFFANSLPPENSRFIAVHTDGSGTELCKRTEGDNFYILNNFSSTKIKCNFDFHEESQLPDFILWYRLPDNFKFWGEK